MSNSNPGPVGDSEIIETDYEIGQDNIQAAIGPFGLDIHNPVFIISAILSVLLSSAIADNLAGIAGSADGLNGLHNLTPAQQAQVINLVRRAAQSEIMPRYQNLADFEIASKSRDDDLVTQADLAAEAIPAVMGPEADAETVRDAVAAMARIPQAAYRQVLQTLVTFNRREDQHRITCPCCLIAGAHDDNSPARVMEKMAERLETATFHIVESAGHLVNSEAGDECNAIIESFLKDLRADTETV